ncbi:MAG: DEAD/DEAH box helicase [Candidatus Latescibacterota bacterium]|jgi:superfamily II DNA or RNA helicase
MARTGGRKPRPVAAGVSRTRKPEELSLEDWQVALRRQYAAGLSLQVRNTGTEPVFSEFAVTNPQTRGTYRVAIRGQGLGDNYCSCPDFAVNTLGTCKHVEYVLGRLRRRRGGAAALAAGFHPPYSEVYLRYGARQEVVFRAGAECPAPVRRLAARHFDAGGVLASTGYGRFHRFLEQLPRVAGDKHEVRCYDDALAFVSAARDRHELQQRLETAYPEGATAAAFSGLLKVALYPYQRDGALFAAKAGRCLLADDMGLGKTVQAIAAAEILARHGGLEHVLVICPTSLKHQWQQEISRFTSRSAVVVEGLAPSRQRGYRTPAFWHIVNYDVVHRDLPLIRESSPGMIILDEAQRIKNWKTRAAQAIKQLDSDYALVLTGTPLENRLEELHSIVQFVDQHRLGPLFRFLATHQQVDENGRVVGYHRLDEIARTLAAVLLRRTKAAVLPELPERLEKRFFVPLTEQQHEHHEENREIVAKIVAKWRRCGYLSEIDQKRLTAALQKMRMACDSTYLLDGHTDHGPKMAELTVLLTELLEDPGAKVVIFSQWLRMHELVSRRARAHGWEYVLFHGGLSSPQRRDVVARFRQDPACRLFLATDAGGVGLNLQHASVVVSLDLPWNPAVLEQRIGRVHRLGQHRPVQVIHFITEQSIEEGILALLAFKRSVFAGVLDGGAHEVFLGGTRLKQFMESVERAAAGSQTAAPEPAAAHGEPTAAALAGSAPTGPGPAKGLAATGPQALAQLLAAGAALLGKLAEVVREGDVGQTKPSADGIPGLVGRDQTTGQAYLRLPLPQGPALEALSTLLQALGGVDTAAGSR